MKKYCTADRLKQIIEERNIKQIDIVKAAEPICEKYGLRLGRSDLSQYISGKVEPGQEKLAILGEALNVNEAWLMGYDIQRTPFVKAKNNNSEIIQQKLDMIIDKYNRLPEEYQIQFLDYLDFLLEKSLEK